MDSKLSISFFFLLVVTKSVHAELEELTPILTYWRSVLPQTPIPATIEQLLHSSETENYSFHVEKSPTFFISYKSAATENQIQNDSNAQLFFLKHSVTPGTNMVLDLTGTTSSPPFLSLKDSMAAPFSSGKLPEILGFFSIQSGSLEAAAVRRALAECEEPPLDGETKRCVTSVESMVEFVDAELGGGDVRVVETAVAGGGFVAGRQEFVVGPAGPRLVCNVLKIGPACSTDRTVDRPLGRSNQISKTSPAHTYKARKISRPPKLRRTKEERRACGIRGEMSPTLKFVLTAVVGREKEDRDRLCSGQRAASLQTHFGNTQVTRKLHRRGF